MQAAFMAQRFQVAGRLVTVDATGGGNVNETFQAIFRTVYSEERFFLQRISPNVFREPERVMKNMLYVTSFVHQRLEEEAAFSDRIWQLPRIIPAKDGKSYTIDGDGYYWRAITAIARAPTRPCAFTSELRPVSPPEVFTISTRPFFHSMAISMPSAPRRRPGSARERHPVGWRSPCPQMVCIRASQSFSSDGSRRSSADARGGTRGSSQASRKPSGPRVPPPTWD